MSLASAYVTLRRKHCPSVAFGDTYPVSARTVRHNHAELGGAAITNAAFGLQVLARSGVDGKDSNGGASDYLLPSRS